MEKVIDKSDRLDLANFKGDLLKAKLKNFSFSNIYEKNPDALEKDLKDLETFKDDKLESKIKELSLAKAKEIRDSKIEILQNKLKELKELKVKNKSEDEQIKIYEEEMKPLEKMRDDCGKRFRYS